MYRVKSFLKRIFTPVTIMFIPHTSRRPFTMQVPSIGIVLSAILCVIGLGYVLQITKDAVLYKPTKEKLDYYTTEMTNLRSTITSLKAAESQFKRIFSFKTKSDVLDNMTDPDSGAIDMESLKLEIEKTMETVTQIREYLKTSRDKYLSTPMGYPVESREISSPYGRRQHPIKGTWDFHTGLDLRSSLDQPVHATADGIVSFSGWSGGSGNLVAIEHGFGYSTYFAHNSKTVVKVGDIVKRGEIVAYSGSTGSSTGPHVHYEIWKDGVSMNPEKFLKGGS